MKKFLIAMLVAGVTMIAAPNAAFAANLVVNGSFETGDFTGWTLSGNTEYTGVTGNFEGVNPTDGSYQAYFGPIGSLGYLSQTIATTPGANYDLSFDLYNEGGTPTEFDVSFDGVVLQSLINSASFGYTTETFTVSASTASTDLVFDFQQDPNYFLLDNVSLTAANAVPEPAVWAMMILGMGMIGASLRRRQAVSVTYA